MATARTSGSRQNVHTGQMAERVRGMQYPPAHCWGVACAQVHVELLPKLARKVEEGVLLTQASQMGSGGGEGAKRERA